MLSESFEGAWFPTLEAGAAWVIETDHNIMTINNFKPSSPLNPHNKLYFNLNKDENSNTIYGNSNDIFNIFEGIAKRYNKKSIEESDFKDELNRLIGKARGDN